MANLTSTKAKISVEGFLVTRKEDRKHGKSSTKHFFEKMKKKLSFQSVAPSPADNNNWRRHIKTRLDSDSDVDDKFRRSGRIWFFILTKHRDV
jgi:uncharacterized protein (DUF4415 family)